jgi:hypothetical protein
MGKAFKEHLGELTVGILVAIATVFFIEPIRNGNLNFHRWRLALVLAGASGLLVTGIWWWKKRQLRLSINDSQAKILDQDKRTGIALNEKVASPQIKIPKPDLVRVVAHDGEVEFHDAEIELQDIEISLLERLANSTFDDSSKGLSTEFGMSQGRIEFHLDQLAAMGFVRRHGWVQGMSNELTPEGRRVLVQMGRI